MTFLLTILLAQTDLTLVVSCEPHCQSVVSQWHAQDGAYRERFAKEYKYINEHFRVRIVDESDFPPSVSYPIVRFGRGGELILLKRMACYPGHFPMAMYDVCRDFRFEMDAEYVDWYERFGYRKASHFCCGMRYPDRPHRPYLADWAFVEDPPVYAPEPAMADSYFD